MAIEFPVPRAQLPRVDVTPHERETRKRQVEQIVRLALDEYEQFRGLEQGRMDVGKWKLVDSQDMLRLYREREAGESVGHALSSTASSSFSPSEDSSESQSSFDRWDDESSTMTESRDGHKALRMVGDLTGCVENAVYAFITRIMREFSLVQTFLHDDVADCAILSELEGPTKEKPLQSLAYKWVVKRTPGTTDKFQDLVFLEACGVTTTKLGEKVGYVLLESVVLPSFPKLRDANCTRTFQSVRILLREKSDNLIDVFATGVAEPSRGKKARPMASQLAAQTMFTLTKAMDLAECMRLTKLLARQRPARDAYIKSRKHKPSACTMCHQKRKLFSDVQLMDCIVCGHAVCQRCYTVKRVFIADGILGRFYRVECCETCLVAVDRSRPFASHSQTPAKTNAAAQRPNSTRNADSMEVFSFSRPRSSSDSSRGDPISKQCFYTLREEETMPPEPSWSQTIDVGSMNRPQRDPPAHRSYSTKQQRPAAPTQPLSSAPQDRNPTHYANSTLRRNVPSSRPAPVAAAGHAEQHQASLPRRQHSSSANGRFIEQPQRPEPALGRPSSSPAMFTSAATAITYDLSGQTSGSYSAAPSAPQPAKPAGHTRNGSQDLMARMMELQRLAESTYQTTRQNELIMQQQRLQGSRF